MNRNTTFSLQESGTGSNILRFVEVPVVNRTRCNELLKYQITSRMFCAGTEEGGKDTCQVNRV